MHHNDLQHDDPIFWSVVTVKAIMNAIINKAQTNKSTIITGVANPTYPWNVIKRILSAKKKQHQSSCKTKILTPFEDST